MFGQMKRRALAPLVSVCALFVAGAASPALGETEIEATVAAATSRIIAIQTSGLTHTQQVAEAEQLAADLRVSSEPPIPPDEIDEFLEWLLRTLIDLIDQM